MNRRSPKLQRDFLSGRAKCRNCGQLVTQKGRRSFCGEPCVEQFKIKYWPSHARGALRDRDHGKCSICGCETERLRGVVRQVRRLVKAYGWANIPWGEVTSWLKEIGFTKGTTHEGDFWQADHIVEVARGGWGKGLENFQTACTPCHHVRTAGLVAALAEKRKSQ